MPDFGIRHHSDRLEEVPSQFLVSSELKMSSSAASELICVLEQTQKTCGHGQKKDIDLSRVES